MSPAESLWVKACGIIQNSVGVNDFETWIVELHAIALDDKCLTLGAPFGLFRDRVMQDFIEPIREAIASASGKKLGVSLAVLEAGAIPAQSTKSLLNQSRATSKKSAATKEHQRTFENFSVAEPNRLAFLAVKQLASGDAPDGTSPLIISGGSGLGKTHLLSAIRYHLLAQKKRVVLCPGEDFVKAVSRDGDLRDFRGQFDSIAALLVSKADVLLKESRGRNEFMRTARCVNDNGGLIVITLDRQIDDSGDPRNNLGACFLNCPIVEIAPLDHESRRSILADKLSNLGILIEDHLIARLATTLHGSVREIEGLISRLGNKHTKNTDTLVGATNVEDFIFSEAGHKGLIDFDHIVMSVCLRYGIERKELLGRDRSRRVAWPRHITAWCCRRLTDASLPQVGNALGGRNHTSILRAVRSVEDRRLEDPSFARELQQLETMIGKAPAPDDLQEAS